MQKPSLKYTCLYEEAEDTLAMAKQYLPAFTEIQYFIRCIEKCFEEWNAESNESKIFVVGSSLPEEIIYAYNKSPFWVLGGSSHMASLADYAVPRDTDPISKSILGYLLSKDTKKQRDLIIIPLVNDSSRKLPYILESAGKQVFTVDIPPYKNDAAVQEYKRQIYRCIHRLGRFTKRIVTERKLKKAYQKISGAYKQLMYFDKLADEKPEVINGICRMLIFFSYYCIDNINEWTKRLSILNERIKKEKSKEHTKNKKNILIIGSPVYFPNYKIPFLAQDIGFNIIGCADYTNLKIMLKSMNGEPSGLSFCSLLNTQYQSDCSSAYPNNDTYVDAVCHLLSTKKIDGVIYHVLKGQIEYDFELNRMEEIFAKYEMPFIRLETDYNPQDIEQLRLRMEAFSEVLHQNCYRKERQI